MSQLPLAHALPSTVQHVPVATLGPRHGRAALRLVAFCEGLREVCSTAPPTSLGRSLLKLGCATWDRVQIGKETAYAIAILEHSELSGHDFGQGDKEKLLRLRLAYRSSRSQFLVQELQSLSPDHSDHCHLNKQSKTNKMMNHFTRVGTGWTLYMASWKINMIYSC